MYAEAAPMVTQRSMLSTQVCVPADWTDEQVLGFVNLENPCGTDHGWIVRRQGDECLKGCDERVQCEKRDGYVHIMLDA